MAWRLDMPSGFGDSFPSGKYVGYNEQLTKYFYEEMPLESCGGSSFQTKARDDYPRKLGGAGES